MARNRLEWILEVDEHDGTASLARYDRAQGKVTRGMERQKKSAGGVNAGMGRLMRTVVALAGSYGLLRLSSGFLKVAASAQKTKFMLEGLTGSAAKAEANFQWIQEFAATAPVDLNATKDAFVKLAVAGIDPTAGSLRTLVDAVSAFGGGSQELQRAAVAIQQMSGKGVISMEELRQQLGEAVPDAMRVMASELNMSVAEMVDLISKGGLDAQRGLAALFTGWEKAHAGASKRMMSGWAGLMSGMATEWDMFRIQVMESGPFNALIDGASETLEKIQELRADGDLDVWAHKMGVVVISAFQAMTAAVGWFSAGIVNVRSNMAAVIAWLDRKEAERLKKQYPDRKKLLERMGYGPNKQTMKVMPDGSSQVVSTHYTGMEQAIAQAEEDARIWQEIAEENARLFREMNRFFDNLMAKLAGYKGAGKKPNAKPHKPGIDNSGMDATAPGRYSFEGEEAYMPGDMWEQIAEERMQIAAEMTDRIKALTLEETEYKRWALGQELAMLREKGVAEEQLAEYQKLMMRDIAAEEQRTLQQRQQQMIEGWANIAAGVGDTFQQLAQVGGRHSKEMFTMYKGFATAEALISTYAAIAKTLKEPVLPFPFNLATAAMIAAKGFAQVAAIKAAQPPSYDRGGISTKPGYYYAGVEEAHIPIPSGGKIPVQITAPGGGTQMFNVILNRPVFQDLATQRAAMVQIAQVVATQVAPGAVYQNYRNDGAMRDMSRGGLG